MFRTFILIILAITLCQPLVAQDTSKPTRALHGTGVYHESWQIDSTHVGHLDFNLKSTLFFRNNEFSTPMLKGYTLPGFRIRPSLGFQPSDKVNIEVGMYMLRFWGANHYPNVSYADISHWKGEDYATKGFHLLPFFRVQMAASGWNFVLGSLYSGYHHRLLDPLYASELNLTADPESGLQILYANRWLDLDTWVNWESFIYKNDTHQEAFTFGLSSRIKYNGESSKIHLYTPVQMLFQHRGGEIDTILTNSVQTLFNGAIGLGSRIDINHRAIKRLTLEADLLAYNQQVGDLMPFDRGLAYYLHGQLDVANIKVKAGYLNSDKFISLFGYPFYGGVSVSDENFTAKRYSTLHLGVDFLHQLSPGYSIGANAMIYRHFATEGLRAGVTEHVPASTSYGACIYFRINPSFLLKDFGR